MISSENMVNSTLQRATDTRALKVGSGAVAECGRMFRELFGSRKAIIVADTQTIALAGQAVQASLSEAGIELYPGVTGDPDEAAAALAAGTLEADLGATCDHHDHGEGHDCGHHGGSCADHGCRE
jgi:hypothetical protein